MRYLRLVPAVLAVVGGVASFSAQAALVTYTGADNAVTSLSQMTNSVAASASFNAAVPGATFITFETPVPPGVSVTGGSITNNSGCGALCGFDTTPGGQFFYSLFGGTATFSFVTPVNAFGMYITGLQTDLVPQETLTFNDGSAQTIDTPTAINGGGAFMGFTDFGESIVSVSYNATNDIVSLDDVRFQTTTSVPTPEPASLAVLGSGLVAFGLLRRRNRSA